MLSNENLHDSHRHPHYLERPWNMQGQRATTEPHPPYLWWVIALLVLLAIFLIGVGVTSEIL